MLAEYFIRFKYWLLTETNLSNCTIGNYLRAINLLPDDITPENPELITILNRLIIHRRRSFNDNNFKYAIEKLLISWDKIMFLPYIAKIKTNPRKIFGTYLDDKKINEICDKIKYLPYKMAALIQLNTGVRVSEALSLTHKNFTFDKNDGAIIQLVGKGKKFFSVYILPEKVKEIGLIEFLAERSVLTYPFLKAYSNTTTVAFQKTMGNNYNNYEIALRNSAKSMGIKFSSHDFRRNFINKLFELGYQSDVVQAMAHHKSVTTTLIYKKESPVDFKEVMLQIQKSKSVNHNPDGI